MWTYMGYLDIPFKEVCKYHDEAIKKKGICKIIPRGRFAIVNGDIRYDGLVCSEYDMKGESTGMGATTCRNCIIKKKDVTD